MIDCKQCQENNLKVCSIQDCCFGHQVKMKQENWREREKDKIKELIETTKDLKRAEIESLEAYYYSL